MRKFHSLVVASVQNETADSLRVVLQVPQELQGEFNFLPGQHLPVQVEIDGRKVRRTYSICSAAGRLPLELGIRIQAGGNFSEYVANNIKTGDRLDVMPPFGQFHAKIDAASSKTYLAFAAGSGITPVLSIMRSILEGEAASRFLLFYGNRRQNSTMFIDDLQALKNRFIDRLQLYFLFTQEEQEFPIFSGRLDAEKTAELLKVFCAGLNPDEAFVCGPDTMIESVRGALVAQGIAEEFIHAERYGAPRRNARELPVAVTDEHSCSITVIMDGHRKSFEMPSDGASIVDAAAENGIELPYSCKGGVCATCRTHVQKGEVTMATNYGLEPWEVDKGFVLACQSRPVSDEVVINYDKT
ncbi:MAG: ring-1,2-phenylacetyl-CoA epoxidase subunit PaaE [Woeseiaceae bacterium]|jgi:ring-1,2-phenylacetyl-CoA epoxidase subunit PaaE